MEVCVGCLEDLEDEVTFAERNRVEMAEAGYEPPDIVLP